MEFCMTVHGLTVSGDGNRMQLRIGNEAVSLTGQALADVLKTLKIARRLSAMSGAKPDGTTEASVATTSRTERAEQTTNTDLPVSSLVGTPNLAATVAHSAVDTAATYDGPTKRGPIQSAARVDGGTGQPRRGRRPRDNARTPDQASATTATVTQSGETRQRGALVRLMTEWFAGNPGPQHLDSVVTAAKDGNWTQASAVRPAVIAGLRRAQTQIRRSPEGTFSLVQKVKDIRPGRIVRRPRQR